MSKQPGEQSPAQTGRICPAGRLTPEERRLLRHLLTQACDRPPAIPARFFDEVNTHVLMMKLTEDTLHSLLGKLRDMWPDITSVEIARMAGCSREEVSRWKKGRHG
jgi:hypothetical protein